MAQLDDSVGALLKGLEDLGIADNTIVVFSTDNGAEVFTWPDGGMTPFRATKGTVYEGGFRVPCIIRWPGKVPAGKVENGIFSGLDWFPTFVAAAGNPNIVDELKAGKDLGGTNYKVHLDGYDQTDLLTGKGPSKRHEIWYFAESNLGGLRLDEFKYRFIDQPEGWPGPKVPINMPILENIKQDPFERLPVSNVLEGSPAYFNDFYAREFWRFVYVQQKVGELGADGHRVSADAERRVVQLAGGEGADRGRDRQGTAWRLACKAERAPIVGARFVFQTEDSPDDSCLDEARLDSRAALLSLCIGTNGACRGRSAAVLERRRHQAEHHRFRHPGDQGGRAGFRRARGPRRHFRQ